MAEGTRLLSGDTMSSRIEGSNPSLSAIFLGLGVEIRTKTRFPVIFLHREQEAFQFFRRNTW